MKLINLTFSFVFLLMTSTFYAQEILIPKPQKMTLQKGVLQLENPIRVQDNKDIPEIDYLSKQLNTIVGIQSKVADKGIITTTTLKPSKKAVSGYYELTIGKKGINIAAADNTGIFYGVQTLLQLVEEHKDNLKLPFLKIEDYPKFQYRGMHLDVGRHFFSIQEIKNYLDYLAAYKYNKFHWHLTEDQGWRIEIKKYPKLQEISAYRNGTLKGHGSAKELCFDDETYGGYYTQEEAKEIVAYAKKLHIDVIPEIEMPGHAQAAVAAYPELGCTNKHIGVWQRWGVSENIYCPSEETFKFLEDVIDEIVEIFPYEYIHIGGDEAPKKQWKESELAQNVIKREGLKNEEELQSYFITRMEKYINSKGRQIIGWDEILEGGLAPNATVMSWTGVEGGIHAAQTGHKAIMTPTSTNYFDYYQGSPENEPAGIGGDLPLSKVYSYNPIDKRLTDEQAEYIWGTQANLWTEYIKTFDHVEYMVFPRMMALAEVAWGTSNPEEYKNFENRVIRHFDILDQKGINYSTAIYEVKAEILNQDGKLFVQLSSAGNPENIKYTTDGSTPTKDSNSYKQPIPITETTTVKSAYFKDGEPVYGVTSQDLLITKSTGKKVTLTHQPAGAYTANGTKTLVDGIRGNINLHTKDWLGFNGHDLEAVIDFGKTTNFNTVRFAALDNTSNWIHLPKGVSIAISKNGKDFTTIKEVSEEELKTDDGNYKISFPQQEARYLRVNIKNQHTIPEGYTGAGHKAWLFVDEIAVE